MNPCSLSNQWYLQQNCFNRVIESSAENVQLAIKMWSRSPDSQLILILNDLMLLRSTSSFRFGLVNRTSTFRSAIPVSNRSIPASHALVTSMLPRSLRSNRATICNYATVVVCFHHASMNEHFFSMLISTYPVIIEVPRAGIVTRGPSSSCFHSPGVTSWSKSSPGPLT